MCTLKKKLILVSGLIIVLQRSRSQENRGDVLKKKVKKRYWMNELVKTRKNNSIYYKLVKEMQIPNAELFHNFIRMVPAKFEELLRLLGTKIIKMCVVREAISPAERLSLTLRYLASGDSITSLAYQFKVGKSTASNIVSETLNVLWEVLKPITFPELTANYLKQLAEECERKTGFPNCWGAIDGKHVQIEAPPNSGTTFRNYKNSFSIVLLAVADIYGRFIYCDIGGFGKSSDGGIFRSSTLYKKLENKTLRLPEPRRIGQRTTAIPYFLIGDAAFPLKSYLMRPYPSRSSLTIRQKIFDKRLSAARKSIERAFGLLSQKFRIFRKPIQLKVENIEKVVKASVCLHNWLFDANENILPNRQETISHVELDLNQYTPLSDERVIRETIADYFMLEGAVDYQWNFV